MKLKRLLILEDDIETVSILLDRLARLENEFINTDHQISFSLTVLSEYTDVEELINKQNQSKYDIILLDRDCVVAGSFHVLDIEKFGVDKVISISSTPPYNEDAKKRGVTRVVHKDYSNLNVFADSVIEHIKELI
jgi:hypothetical protein